MHWANYIGFRVVPLDRPTFINFISGTFEQGFIYF